MNLKHVQATAQAEGAIEWLLHIDADELLWLPDGMAQEIAKMEPDQDWLALRPLERIWAGRAGKKTFGGVFRAPLKSRQAVRKIYGKAEPFLRPVGFSSYATHKPLFPVATSHLLGVHGLHDRQTNDYRPHRVAPTGYILHFASLTPMHWATKLLRYAVEDGISANKRRPYLRALNSLVQDPDIRTAALKMYEFSTVLPRKSIAELKRRGLLHAPKINLKRSVRVFAPGIKVDLTMRRLERTIKPRFEEVVAEVETRRSTLNILPPPRPKRDSVGPKQ